MSHIRLFLAAILTILLAAGCGDVLQHYSNKYVGVKKVFMHENGVYSVFVPSEKGGYIQKGLVKCEATFFEDVPPEEDMRAEEVFDRSYWHGFQNSYCTFHIHSLKEIGGGGWDHGKSGHGQTNVIE